MGIFPTSFKSHHSIFIGSLDKSEETLGIISKYKEQTVVLRLWQNKDKLIEIDEWIGGNITDTSYYYENWPVDEPTWMQSYIFTKVEDAVAFRLRWIEYEQATR